MALYQYKGSPDVFDEKGVWQSSVPSGQTVEQLGILRPDIKTEADFKTLSRKNIAYSGDLGMYNRGETILPDTTAPTAPTTPNAPTFDTGSINEIKSSTLTNQYDKFDIAGLLEQRKKERLALEEAMKPTEQETDLSRQLIEKKSEIEREKTGLQKTLTGMEYGTQTTAHIAGQMSRAQKESLLRQQALGVEEANLISRLGLEEKKREGQITKAQTLLGYSNDDIELSFKIQDKLESQKKDYLNRVEKISENAKAKLDDLLEMFDGLDYNDLKPAEQQQLIELANSAGVPMDLLARGMKIEKDNFIYNRLQKEKTIEWSDPYLMGGDYVQRNLKTGEIRTAVNIPKGARGAGTELERMMKEFNLTPQQMVDTYVDAALSGMEVEPPASLEAQVLQGVMKKKKEMEEASKKPTEEVRSLQLPSARELGENVAALRYFPEAMTETVKGGVSSFWGKLKDFGSGVASGLLK